MTPKQLTEEAFELYYKIKDANNKKTSLYQSKRLSLATDKSFKRYKRRLKAWWDSKS